MKHAFVYAALVLTACVDPTPPELTIVTAPDGEPATIVRCGYWPEKCYRTASALCANGYEIVHREANAEAHAWLVRCK